MNDWQSWAALGVVGITAMIFLVRNLRPNKKGSCGGGCACAQKPGKIPAASVDRR
jgi:hypothetical protein